MTSLRINEKHYGYIFSSNVWIKDLQIITDKKMTNGWNSSEQMKNYKQIINSIILFCRQCKSCALFTKVVQSAIPGCCAFVGLLVVILLIPAEAKFERKARLEFTVTM